MASLANEGGAGSGGEAAQNLIAISEETDVLVFDGSDDQFAQLRLQFQADTLPFVIIFNDGNPTISEQPNAQTVRKLRAFKGIQLVNNVPQPEQETAAQQPAAPAETFDAAEEQVEVAAEAEVEAPSAQEEPAAPVEESPVEEAPVEEETNVEETPEATEEIPAEEENRQPGPQTVFQQPRPQPAVPAGRPQPQQILVRDPRTGQLVPAVPRPTGPPATPATRVAPQVSPRAQAGPVRTPGQQVVRPTVARPAVEPETQPKQPEAVAHEIEATEEDHHVTSGDEHDTPTTVTEFEVGAASTGEEPTEAPVAPVAQEPLVHLSTPARYRHPDAQPTAPADLADLEDFKYHGYIPVDHSVFTSDFTFDGEVPVEENVADLGVVTKHYIDPVEAVPEEAPVAEEPASEPAVEETAPVAVEPEVAAEPLAFPFDNQGVFHPSQPNPVSKPLETEEEPQSIRAKLTPRPAAVSGRPAVLVIEREEPAAINHIFHSAGVTEILLPTHEFVEIEETIVEPFVFLRGEEAAEHHVLKLQGQPMPVRAPVLAQVAPRFHPAPVAVRPTHLARPRPPVRVAAPTVARGYHTGPQRVSAPVHHLVQQGPIATRLAPTIRGY